MTFKDFTGTITAPPGAVPVDLKALEKNFMGEKSASAGSSVSAPAGSLSALKCSELESLSKSQLQMLVAQIPKSQLKELAHHCPSLRL
jgi:hypothetical protein